MARLKKAIFAEYSKYPGVKQVPANSRLGIKHLEVVPAVCQAQSRSVVVQTHPVAAGEQATAC